MGGSRLLLSWQRCDLPIAQTDLLRAKAGGATRSAADSPQSTTLFSGSLGGGRGGSAKVGDVGAGGLLGGAINAVGPYHCCDPDLFVSYGWSNAITPLNYTVVSGVRIETTHQTAISAANSQGFLTGTSISVSEASTLLSFADLYMDEVAGLVLDDADPDDLEPKAMQKETHRGHASLPARLRDCRNLIAAHKPLPAQPSGSGQPPLTCAQQFFFRGLPEAEWSPELNAKVLEIAQTKVAMYDG